MRLSKTICLRRPVPGLPRHTQFDTADVVIRESERDSARSTCRMTQALLALLHMENNEKVHIEFQYYRRLCLNKRGENKQGM